MTHAPIAFLLAASLLCTACGTEEDDCQDEIWYQDVDGDGYGDDELPLIACERPEDAAVRGGDCDDANASANPDATELWYDGADQDCDGADDFDQDGDGFTVESSGGDDCDDTDPQVHPDASDAPYDGVDSNCDGESDYDFDRDGHDAQAYGGDDCDDTDPDVNPGAEEIWYDGVDEDCDGGSDHDQDGDGFDSQDHVVDGGDCDDEDPEVNPDQTETWYDDIDSNCDQANDFDLDADGYESQDYGGDDCDDGNPDIHPGAFEWNDGDDNDCNGDFDVIYLDDADASLLGEEEGDQLGVSVAVVGDINGDGFDDVAAGGHAWPAGSEQGAAWLVLGPVTGELDLWFADARIAGRTAGDRAGHPVAGAGDVNGDGFDDLLVAAHQESSAANQSGSVYLLHGPLTGDLSVGDALTAWQGEAAFDLAGTGIDGGADITGDGDIDVLVGAFDHDGSAGAAWIVSGASTGTTSLADAPVRLVGEQTDDNAGREVAAVGDTDGDGQQDLLVGAWGNDEIGTDSGAAYLFHGPVTSSGSLALADTKLLGEVEGDKAGYSVAPAGDADGDGYADLLVGAPYNDTRANNGGAAYLVLGPLTGDRLDLGVAEATFGGDQDDALAGYDVHTAGDFDGDGKDDIAVGAPTFDQLGTNDGAVYVVLGRIAGSISSCSSDVKLHGTDSGTNAGSALGGGGDLNSDGYDDLLIGAPGAVSTDGTTGGAFMLLGSER